MLEPQSSPSGAPQQPTVSLSRRFAALFADWVLSVLVSSTFANPTTQGWAPVLVLILEYGLFIGVASYTPGMYLLKIRCVRVGDGAPIGIPRALLRGFLLALVVPPLVMDERQRGLHDRAAGSIVTRA